MAGWEAPQDTRGGTRDPAKEEASREGLSLTGDECTLVMWLPRCLFLTQSLSYTSSPSSRQDPMLGLLGNALVAPPVLLLPLTWSLASSRLHCAC